MRNNSQFTKNQIKHYDKQNASERISTILSQIQMSKNLVLLEHQQGFLTKNRLNFYTQGLKKLKKEYESLRNILNT